MSLLEGDKVLGGQLLMSDVVVGIPTFRRPVQLRQLLETLESEVTSRDVTIIIADNACAEDTVAVVTSFAPRMPRIIYAPVRERGLASVRNALVATATANVADWRWLAMLDDDGLATPGWLERIVACGERFAADLVGGPVDGVLPEGAGRLARNSVFAKRKSWETGLVPTLNTTQNLLIARALTERIGLPLFNPIYGASGGEDYDLFRRTACAGGRIVWCSEALVREPAPADRLSVAMVLARYYSTGIYMSRIDSSYDGAPRTWLLALKGLAAAIVRTVRDLARCDVEAAARGLLSIIHYTGRITGLMGGKTRRYVQHGGERL